MVSTNIFAIKSLHPRTRKYSVPRVQLRLGVRSSLLLVEGGKSVTRATNSSLPQNEDFMVTGNHRKRLAAIDKNTKKTTPEICAKKRRSCGPNSSHRT